MIHAAVYVTSILFKTIDTIYVLVRHLVLKEAPRDHLEFTLYTRDLFQVLSTSHQIISFCSTVCTPSLEVQFIMTIMIFMVVGI